MSWFSRLFGSDNTTEIQALRNDIAFQAKRIDAVYVSLKDQAQIIENLAATTSQLNTKLAQVDNNLATTQKAFAPVLDIEAKVKDAAAYVGMVQQAFTEHGILAIATGTPIVLK